MFPEKVSTGMLRLRTFGGLSIEGEAGALTGAATQRRPLALLALLAVACERGCNRDDLLLYLWPESTPDRARHVLKQTLYTLRRDLRAPDLFIGSGELRLNPAIITSDTAEFENALERGDRARAVELYRGSFLEGFHLRESPEFEQWRKREGARLLLRFSEAAASLAAEATQRGDCQCAIRLWRRLAAADPLNVDTTLGLMNALVVTGDPAGAIQHARVYKALAGEGRAGEPDPRVSALAEYFRTTLLRSSGPQPMTLAEPPMASTEERRLVAADRPARSLPIRAGPRRAARSIKTGLPRWRTLAWWLPAVTVVLALALAGVGRYVHHQQTRRQLDPDLLVVAPYQVLDPGLQLWREGLVDVLSRSLDGVGSIRTVAPSVAVQLWRGHPDPESTANLGHKTGAGLAVSGSLVRAGRDSLRVTAMVVEVASGRVLGEVTRQGALADMGRLTDSLTLAILRELEPHRLLSAAQPAAMGVTHSLEALKAFLQGEQFYRRAQWDSARAHYQHAIERDSTFALALQRVGNVLSWQRLTVDSLALSYLLRAGALNHGLSPRESLLVAPDSLLAAANLAPSSMEQWRHTRRLFATLEEAARRYPESPAVWLALGEARYHFGRGPGVGVSDREVLAAFGRAITLDPGFAPAYIHSVELGFNLGGRNLGLRYARTYLSLDPQEPAHHGVRLAVALTDPGERGTADISRLLDTAATEALVSARTILRRWPDSAETAVLLGRLLAQGRPSRYPLFSDTSFMRKRLAQQLAFRGHVHEAYTVLGNRELPIFAELAYLGAVPSENAAGVFRRWGKVGSEHARLALPWWSARRDTAAIKAFHQQASRRANAGLDTDTSARAEYDTAAARAHLLLARGDTAAALGRFRSLPDTLCSACYIDRLIRAQLMAARGRDREALVDLAEPLDAFLTPLEVVFALERGRVAERLGEREEAEHSYGFVADAWARADSELRAYVAAARAGLTRAGAE
jgi:DNA-binding SARP family transcriptional activator/tetratricopeptide (TPR) repeat protein